MSATRFDPVVCFTEIAKGDHEAFRFMIAAHIWFHTLDDLIDRDHLILVATVIKEQYQLFCELASNPFFLRNKETILALLLASGLAYVRSEELSRSEAVLDRIGSQVLKSHYQQLYYHIAYLVGGYIHAQAMIRKYCVIDADPVLPPGSQTK